LISNLASLGACLAGPITTQGIFKAWWFMEGLINDINESSIGIATTILADPPFSFEFLLIWVIVLHSLKWQDLSSHRKSHQGRSLNAAA
jgi:hypothetical protein